MPSLNDAINANRDGLVSVDNNNSVVGPPIDNDLQPVFNPLMRCPLPGSLVDSLRQFYRKDEVPQSRLFNLGDANRVTSSVSSSTSSTTVTSGGSSSFSLPKDAVVASLQTPLLAVGAQYISTITLAKAFLIIHVSVNGLARIELYSTATAQAADVNRGAVAPLSGSQHGIIFDLYPQSDADLNWIMSPAAPGANQDDPQSTVLYITVTNISTNNSDFLLGIIYVPDET